MARYICGKSEKLDWCSTNSYGAHEISEGLGKTIRILASEIGIKRERIRDQISNEPFAKEVINYFSQKDGAFKEIYEIGNLGSIISEIHFQETKQAPFVAAHILFTGSPTIYENNILVGKIKKTLEEYTLKIIEDKTF